MSPEELNKVLQSHQLWLTSDGKEGERANLEGVELERAGLQGADLQNAILNGAAFKNANLIATNLQGARLLGASFDGANLRGADLRNALLEGAVFKDAKLIETNLQGGQLRRATFDGAILRRANLREADLENASLENAKFLLSSQLAGSNVAGAKLPAAIAEFKGLETIAEATSNAQKLFVAMLGGCLYSWLTIGTTKDAALLTNSASSPLPIIGTALPIVGFYMVAPVVLLAMYFYFHLNMQRLWEALADLPAVFPDGRSLDKRADPWLLNGLVSAHFVRLRRERRPLSRVQQWLSILLAWWIVPATLFVFWGRFLVRHDWFGTDLHITLLAAAIGFGSMSYRLARATLRGAPRKLFLWAQAWKDRRTFKRVAGIFATCVLAVVLYLVSFGAIGGIPPDDLYSVYSEYDLDSCLPSLSENDLRILVPRVLGRIRLSPFPFANLYEEDVSTKPPNWTGQPTEDVLVKGARLDNARMEYAYADLAFLVNAKLRSAKLRKASLVQANLSHADLSHADLSNAVLANADLNNANLSEADMSCATLLGADLSDARLSGANLSEADLGGADLTRAKLNNANLTSAHFPDAHLQQADLSLAELAEADLTNADLTEADLFQAKLSGAYLARTNLSNAKLHYCNLSKAYLVGADLTGADVTATNLDEANLKGVDLRTVKGLTKSQIQKAIKDKNTLLPPDLPP